MKLTFLKVARACLALFLISFPLQIRKLIYYPEVFLTGNFNYYTSVFLYVSDLFLLAAFAFWLVALVKKESPDTREIGYKEFFIYLMAFIALIFFSVYVSSAKVLSLFLGVRFLEFMLLYIMVANEVLDRQSIMKYFLGGMVFQALIGIFQYSMQGSLGLRFLGEAIIGPDVPGVAKLDLAGEKIVRAYGTFTHPNVFGGALVFALAFAFYKYKSKLTYLLPIVAILALALLFTFSRSAFLALLALFLVFISASERKVSFKEVFLFGSMLLFFLVLFNLESTFWQRFVLGGDLQAAVERFDYLAISKKMLFESPWGVGLGNFTLDMQNYTVAKLSPWLYQPVHNVFLLIINEIGVVGGGFFLFLNAFLFYKLALALKYLRKGSRDRIFCAMMIGMHSGMAIVFLFDHYFFTIYQGQVMMMLYFSLASSFLNSPELPFRKS